MGSACRSAGLDPVQRSAGRGGKPRVGAMRHDGFMRRLSIVVLIVGLALTWFLVVDTSPDLDQGDPVAVTSAEQSLPAQARDTIELIEAGGPYPYRRDGAVFENREGRLPDQERGYWREYTVPTPGSDDRGARRVVTGEDGELYYTDDHYASFLLVRDGSGGDSS